MTSITRPCPHCDASHDITHRSIGGTIWCRSCGQLSCVAVHGRIYLAPCDTPDGTETAQEPTADAALVAEMSALRAELETAKQVICEMLSEFSREMRHVPHDQEQRWRRAAGLSEIKE